MSTLPTCSLHVVTAPGLEPVTRDEVVAAGVPVTATEPGVVVARGTLADAFRLNLRLRTATRVLLELGTFPAPGRRELASFSRRFKLDPYVAPGAPLRMHVTSAKSKLFHTGLVEEVLRESLGHPDGDGPELFVRLVRDRCTLSIDTTGELLHKRGWRVETGRAPLRETLAAGTLLLAGWDAKSPLVDPMCGSGTFAIEAALLAMDVAPGLERTFACEQFPSADRPEMQRIRDLERSRRHPPAAAIHASDVHAGSLSAARRNAERAGVAEHVLFDRADVATLAAPAPTGLLVTNPPYGERIAAHDTEAALRTALLGPFRTWRRALFAPPGFARRVLARPPDRAFALKNGGIPIELAIYDPTS